MMDISWFRAWLVLILAACAGVIVHSASVWFEDPPRLDDPCTIIVVQTTGIMDTIHPPIKCREQTGLAWFATFSRVRLYLFYDLESNETKRRDFELCLTSALPERVYIWYDNYKNGWGPISAPVWHVETLKSDRCHRSQNGTMNLFLEPPWAFVNYVSHITWTVVFIDELPLEEQMVPLRPPPNVTETIEEPEEDYQPTDET